MNEAYDVIFQHYAKLLDAVDYVDFRESSDQCEKEEKPDQEQGE